MKLLEEYQKKILKRPLNDGVCRIWYEHDGKPKAYELTICHAGMSYLGKGVKSVATQIRYRDKTDGANEFIEWLVSPLSAYKPLLDYLGEDISPIRNDDGRIEAILVTNTKVNNKVLTNFFKATRSVYEHHYVLPFWLKWRHKNPALAFALSYFIDEKGGKIRSQHNCLDYSLNGNFAISRILNTNHKDWKLDTHTLFEGNRFTGEMDYTWKGKFNIYRGIPIIKKGEVPTKWWKLYYGEKLDRFSDETLENFFDIAQEGRL